MPKSQERQEVRTEQTEFVRHLIMSVYSERSAFDLGVEATDEMWDRVARTMMAFGYRNPAMRHL